MSWQETNDDYLEKAVAWLRLVLERRVAACRRPVVSRGRRFFGWREPAPAPEARRVSEAEVARAASAMAEADAGERPPALTVLSERLGLSGFERRVLLLAVAMELDTRIPGLCAAVQGDGTHRYPTFALALSLFEDAAWETLSPERPLRYWRLLEVDGAARLPLTSRPLRADERIVNYVKGLNHVDERLSALLRPVAESRGAARLPPSQQRLVDAITKHLGNAAAAAGAPVIQLLGIDGASKLQVAAKAAAGLGRWLFRLPAAELPSEGEELEILARLWRRESLLMPLALFLETGDGHQPSLAGGVSAPQRFLARCETLTFLDTRDLQPGIARSTLSLDVAKPLPSEQEDAWERALGARYRGSAPALAGQFNLNLGTIECIARLVSTAPPAPEDDGSSDSFHERLWDACLMETRPRLDMLAQRIDVKASWNDIVLPEEERSLLRRIADQVAARSRVYDQWGFRQRMNRGLGITALFSGESGTGKTMAAEVIAGHLRLNLYRIDLSGVVSKYIGETEKNLRRLFDAAEDGGALLFFDEADALFGKRSEVKDSHDRYANIEVNYLLQRMEAYAGVAILATNMRSALDAAFVRRLRFIVDFSFPSEANRKAIWKRAFPEAVPRSELDWDRLARLNLTGGSIHNIALNAAFRAAHESTAVSMPIVLDMSRAEFRKMERPINESDFRWEVSN